VRAPTPVRAAFLAALPGALDKLGFQDNTEVTP
jgi:hypothetical protein